MQEDASGEQHRNDAACSPKASHDDSTAMTEPVATSNKLRTQCTAHLLSSDAAAVSEQLPQL